MSYGTYGAASFDRDGLSVPARSDTALRATTTYNTDGTVKQIEDPKRIVTYFEYDAAGRRIRESRNYNSGVNSGNPSGTDDNVTTRWAYTDGLLATLTADMPSGTSDEVTTYTYGTTKGASAGDSKIGTGHLLKKTAYPDSANDADSVKLAYNAQSQVTWTIDQAGNVIETNYSDTGRQTHRRVTTLIGGFDGAVKRISTTFDSLGRRQLVAQYDNATVGSGALVDEVKFTYDDWSNVEKFEQDRNSAVGGGGSVDDYEVAYTYAKATGGRNTVRRSTMTVPSSNVITFEYSSGDYHDDVSSRVSQVKDGDVRLSTYDYNGVGQVVGMKYSDPQIMSKQYTSTPGDYADLDRFNRPVTSKWTRDLDTDRDFYKTQIAWDRNSNVTRIEDDVHAGFDVSYSNDDVNRLTRAEEGTWNGSAITSRTRDQQWTLDHVGNWSREKLDLTGDGDFIDANEHDDTRTHNAVNELTARDTDSNSSNNYTLSYDAPGALTDDGETYTYEYDAYARLRKVKNRSGGALVAEYKYNGLGFRLSVHEDMEPDGDVDGSDPWYHHAYDERWRMVATYRGDDASPKEEFLNHQAGAGGWGGSSYIDLVIARDKDANTGWTSASDGVLEQRIYYCQSWRADVSALVATSGEMLEWAKYSAYGVPFGLPGGDTNSDGDCDAADVTQIQTWIDAPAYDVRGDIDLNGVVDATDKSTVIARYQGTTLGRTVLSSCRNPIGSGGYPVAGFSTGLFVCRNRVFSTTPGRWTARDRIGYWQSLSLYEYALSVPVVSFDPYADLAIPVVPWWLIQWCMQNPQECMALGGLGQKEPPRPPLAPPWDPSKPCEHIQNKDQCYTCCLDKEGDWEGEAYREYKSCMATARLKTVVCFGIGYAGCAMGSGGWGAFFCAELVALGCQLVLGDLEADCKGDLRANMKHISLSVTICKLQCDGGQFPPPITQ